MTRGQSYLVCLALTLAAGLTLERAATAQTFNWNAAGGGSFHTAGNWTPAGGPPGAANVALFNLAGNYTVSFTSAVTNNLVTLGGGTVNWALGGQTYTINSSVNVSSAAGPLTVTNGNVNSNTLNVGHGLGLEGRLTVSSGATWSSAGGFAVGGGGSTATSTLLVQNGGDLTTNGSNSLGSSAGATGQLTLNGSGTVWTHTNSAQLTSVGFSGGTGELRVENGAVVNSVGSLTFGVTGGTGNAVIQGAGTAVNLNGTAQITLGSSGTGIGLLRDGAVLSSANGLIGTNPGGNGTMTVKSQGAQWNVSGFLEVGGTSSSTGESGILNVQTGGLVNVGTNLRLWGAGTLNLAGGIVTTPTVTFSGGVINWTAGQLNYTTSQTLTATLASNLFGNPTTLGANRILSSTQTLTVATQTLLDGGQLVASTVINDSTLIVNSGAISATQGFTNNANRLLLIQGLGGLQASTSFNNLGTIQMDGPATAVGGAGLNNSGLLMGTGTINSSLANSTGGTVRATGSERLVFTTATNNNSGNLELLGGTLEFRQTLTNQTFGAISGRGALQTSTQVPGGLGLINNGVMLFSAGTMDIRGDVQNNAGARIVTAGGGVTTFFDDVTHNGLEIRTNAGARTVFFGSQSGAGAFTGVGTVEYNGDTRPGNSPALVTYEGDVEFTFSSRLTIEIGGLTPGSEFDQLSVTGGVFLGGGLNVVFFGSFTPAAGQSFRIIDNAGTDAVVGTFLGLAEGDAFLAGGQELRISYQGGTGNDVVLSLVSVPEPGLFALLGVASASYGWYRRQRRLTFALDTAAAEEETESGGLANE